MPFDAFLQIEGVPGESTDENHLDWIEILSYSHGVSQPGSGSVSSGGARRAVTISPSKKSLLTMVR